MNTENIIEFIRRGYGLRCANKTNLAQLYGFIFSSVVMLCVGLYIGGYCNVIAAVSCVIGVVHIIFVILLLRKKCPIKYKLIVGFTTVCWMLCYLAFLFTIIYFEFYMPENGFICFFVVLVLIPVFQSLFYSFRLNSPKRLFSKKTSIKNISLSWYGARITLGTLIFSALFEYFGFYIPERTLEIIVIYLPLIFMYVLSFNLLDLQRYYCYTKLEKMGLVTEDILKPDE